ncbi:hypothetical protein EJ05DRAFT_498107 [Pseudovirgaria hyperparasitica]|uniref:Uncharacterized protein n=1 Tax=Pseudovirgaria hyperparasitica TaxID=470096 RepID=A0A6A6WBB4_9PEZI|nr:uncharacterized protein EJ05DRAFT_498107 [Pseudovirgaria hyperparasitica]KAF2760138.1 hypothetical protein EJ05DRAFT_498107 [Pseudovirgaria hyperparasitica]
MRNPRSKMNFAVRLLGACYNTLMSATPIINSPANFVGWLRIFESPKLCSEWLQLRKLCRRAKIPCDPWLPEFPSQFITEKKFRKFQACSMTFTSHVVSGTNGRKEEMDKTEIGERLQITFARTIKRRTYTSTYPPCSKNYTHMIGQDLPPLRKYTTNLPMDSSSGRFLYQRYADDIWNKELFTSDGVG